MEYRVMGKTGLRASVMGIGAGGASRLGQRDNIRSRAESIDLVLRGIDAGINLIDTAEGYGTEDIVAGVIANRDRSRLIISSKKSLGKQNISPEALRDGLQGSLRRLGTDYIDIYHLHGLRLEQYDYYRAEILPELQALKQAGLIRFIGVTEHWNAELEHDMLRRALKDDVWDVIMVGFNLLNQRARESVLRLAHEKGVGVLIMFAVRRALSSQAELRATLSTLIERGELEPSQVELDDPLGFLLHDGSATSLPDAAYRFCRAEAGPNIILSGTGNPRHLEANLASFQAPPLPPAHIQRLKQLFHGVHSITGQ